MGIFGYRLYVAGISIPGARVERSGEGEKYGEWIPPEGTILRVLGGAGWCHGELLSRDAFGPVPPNQTQTYYALDGGGEVCYLELISSRVHSPSHSDTLRPVSWEDLPSFIREKATPRTRPAQT